MKKVVMVLMFLPLLSGCDESADASENDNRLSTCSGYGAPSINILVKDSLNEEITIDTAIVNVHIQDESNNIIEAIYIPDDDNNVDTEQYSYWAPFEVNSNEFNFGIVVSEPIYHSFVSKNIPLTVNTSCGANNSINYTVYLCPMGTSCL